MAINKNKQISIIIPTYNRLETLRAVLPSYINQNFVKEIILIDDFSNDKTKDYLLELAKGVSKIKYFRNSKNMGGPYSKNRAISLSTGKYIFIGEDDLELTDNYFKALLDHMKKSNADIISGRRLWLQKGESKIHALLRHNNTKGLAFDKYLLITYCGVKLKKDTELPLVDASMLIKKKVFDSVSYDEYYRKTAWREETDFQISALRQGFKIVFCPHVYNFHLFKINNVGGNHSHSLLNYEFAIFKNNLYMSRKHWGYIKESFGINSLFFFRFLYYRISKLLINKIVEIKRKS